MKSLEQKTIRPGSLNDFSYYHSARQLPTIQAPRPKAARQPIKINRRLLAGVAVIVVVFAAVLLMQKDQSPTLASNTDTPKQSAAATLPTKEKKAAPAVSKVTNACEGNTLDKFVKVSVGQRRLWACEGTKKVHETAVITGMEKHESTLTPRGTYKIYAKQADTVLSGSDEAGSWRVPVDYWMPFLDNEHGTYGFHDANWRKASEFGKIDPYNPNDKASHGCVELPTASSKWLFDWAPPGTTLTVTD